MRQDFVAFLEMIFGSDDKSFIEGCIMLLRCCGHIIEMRCAATCATPATLQSHVAPCITGEFTGYPLSEENGHSGC